MTTAECLSYVRSLWGQTAANGGGVTDLEIVDYLNAKQTELCSDSDVLVSGWTASTVAGQQQYTVPPEYTSVEFINLYQTTGGLGKYQLTKRDMIDIPADKAPGNPTIFARWGLNVSSSNQRAFWVYPVPTAATVSTNDLECYGRETPVTMVSGGAGPEVDLRWQRAICHGALALVYRRLAASKREYFALADRMEATWMKDKDAALALQIRDVYKPGRAKDTMGYTLGGY